MLLRAVGRRIINTYTTRVRTICLTRIACGGGGHHHEPVPVYIPQPGSLDWSLCGNPGSKNRISEDSPYKPGGDDFASFIGAGVFVALTIAAVLYKTETFKKKDHFAHHSKEHDHKEHKTEKVEEKVTEVESKPDVVEVAHIENDHKKSEVESSSQETEKEAKPSGEASTPSVSQVSQDTQQSEVKEDVKDEEKPSVSHEETRATVDSTENQKEVEESSTTSDSKESRLHCEYVIIGSGTAAYYASLAIRAKQGEAKVLMIGEEDELPYNRPPLSKELWWYGDDESADRLNYTALSGKKRDIFYEVDGFFVRPENLGDATHGGVSLLRGKRAVKICAQDKTVILDDGSTISYDKVLIATGSRPSKEKMFEEVSDEAKKYFTYYHFPADFKRVEKALSNKSVRKVTIIGNGLLASELAYSIKRKYEDVEINQVFRENYAAESILPEHLAKKSTDAIREMGVKIHNKTDVSSVQNCCKDVVLKLKDGSSIRTDLVIIAKEPKASSELAEASGLRIDAANGGIVADKTMKVADSIWTAGAVASFDDAILGRRRIDSWEHAQTSGRLAGENMVVDKKEGAGKAFWYQPSFFTKFAPHLHFNAVGRVDSKMDTVTVRAEVDKSNGDEPKMEKAVVFYKDPKDGKVVGVLLVNVFGAGLDTARRIIDDQRKIEDFSELAKLFQLYEPPKENDEEAKQ